MISVRQFVRRAAQHGGLDLRRYPRWEPLWKVVQLLGAHHIDLVLDVGAHSGGFATGIRQHGYTGRLLSFEPLEQPFRDLREMSMSDGAWDVMQCAIGAERGRVVMNVAGNAGASSSVLPMLDRHLKAAPSSAYVGTEEVELHRLDQVVPTMRASPEDRIFLKIDVQGYERAVLDGAADLLASGRIVGLQMEVSFTSLYEGGMTWREGFDRAEGLGMTLMSVDPMFADPTTGQILQADVVFFRGEA